MFCEVSLKIGGQQGEGIESTGEIIAKALCRLGYQVYGYRHFSSRIQGGHTNYKLRISIKPVAALADNLDLVIALDHETIDLSCRALNSGGLILADNTIRLPATTECLAQVVTVPFSELAAACGSSQAKNVVAIGVTAAALGLPIDFAADAVAEHFGHKGAELQTINRDAMTRGYNYVKEELPQLVNRWRLLPAEGQKYLFLTGNEAIALGAVCCGARFMAAYPITPASEIMENLVKLLPALGGVVIQTEDEIAACTMAIGANYGGVRAFTASSGPGLSLMVESIGLAGMTETPLVIVNVQRGGPSTGLPTKHEQSDILAMLYATHGEIPKIVMAPCSVADAFYDTAEAFNLAEEYQCPVIVLSDLQLSLGKQAVVPFALDQVSIRRGKLQTAPLPPLPPNTFFKRYAVTNDGISPRVVPGQLYGIHHVTGLEHDETGKPSEQRTNRQEQTDKRLRKLQELPSVFKRPVHIDAPYEVAEVLIIGMGGAAGAVAEVTERLRQEGVKANYALLRLIEPFPVDAIKEIVAAAQKVLVVEHNATRQLAKLIKLHTGEGQKIISVLKYDGDPFIPGELHASCKGWL